MAESLAYLKAVMKALTKVKLIIRKKSLKNSIYNYVTVQYLMDEMMVANLAEMMVYLLVVMWDSL
jgi:hypothetical protein